MIFEEKMAKHRQQQRNRSTLLASFFGQAGTVFFLFGVEGPKKLPSQFPPFLSGQKTDAKKCRQKEKEEDPRDLHP